MILIENILPVLSWGLGHPRIFEENNLTLLVMLCQIVFIVYSKISLRNVAF